VLFDLDGTLLDTSSGIFKSICHAVNEMGLPKIPPAKMSSFIGPPLEWSFKNHYNFSDSEAAECVDIFRAVYKEKFLFDANLYKGIIELLGKLTSNGCHIGIATYKRHDFAISIIDHFGLNRFSGCNFGSSRELNTKDEIIKACIKHLDADQNQTVYIGDTLFDTESAANTGIDFIGVTYGFGFTEGTANQTAPFPCISMVSDTFELANELLDFIE